MTGPMSASLERSSYPRSRARADGSSDHRGRRPARQSPRSGCEFEALDRAERAQGLAAFSTLQPEHALERASQIDAQVAAGDNPGRLAGVPIAIKDNIAQAGMPMTAASRILEGYTAPSTATALARLEAEGAIVIGRTNMDEFGMGSSGENSALGPTLNPVHTDHVPGGSSSDRPPPSPRELCRWLWGRTPG